MIGGKQLHDAGQHEYGEGEDDDVVDLARFQRVLRQRRALDDGDLLEIACGFDAAPFERGQRGLVDVLRERWRPFRGAGILRPSG
jgi:hypothetical protein